MKSGLFTALKEQTLFSSELLWPFVFLYPQTSSVKTWKKNNSWRRPQGETQVSLGQADVQETLYIQRTSSLTSGIYLIIRIKGIGVGVSSVRGRSHRWSQLHLQTSSYGALGHSTFGSWWTVSRISKTSEKDDKLGHVCSPGWSTFWAC